ncbi:RES domain-containing protein [Saccharicrinis aurantiacus]|uniref:RES domain-containing protein n=1 Tax=Saccharicrinis aurantiacus TaxID=1849719 RepID=UPI000838C2BA|nr:RES domain-containing protein [Saccharicrinis aurantiacus]
MSKIDELYKVRDVLHKVDYSTLCGILDSYLPRIPISIKDFKNERFELKQKTGGGSNLLFRARILNSDTSYKTLSEISYITEKDKHLIKDYGRVNRPSESMFYASSDILTACVETFSKGENMERFLAKGNLVLVVGVWKINKPMSFAQMVSPESHFEEFIKDFQFSQNKVNIDSVRKYNSWLKRALNDEEQFKILEFFSEEFAKTDIKNGNDYMLTNYYKDRVLNRNSKYKLAEELDGIWYQSVVSSYQETNVAIPPNVVDEKLEFLWADTLWCIHEAKSKRISLNPMQQRAHVGDENILNWK